jgi:hypothetical protein
MDMGFAYWAIAGILAILHVMADRGEAGILATISANRNRWCGPALDAINTCYGRGDLPIGCSRTGPDPEEWYRKRVVEFPHDLRDSNEAPPAVDLYRKILAAQPDTPILLAEDSIVSNATPTEKGAILRRICEDLKVEGVSNLCFPSNRDMLGADGDGTVDGCHPNDVGMRRQATVFSKALSGILGKAK